MSVKRSRFYLARKLSRRKWGKPATSASQQLFHNVFYNSPVAIVLSQFSNGRFLQVNPSFLTLTGYTRSEVVGLTSAQAGITTNLELREQVLGAMQRGESVPDFEEEIRCKSGEIRTGLVTLKVVSINDEKFILNTFIDITARKRAERQVVQMKRLYATLSQVNQTIVRVREHNELFQSICDVAVQFGNFSLAWIGLLDKTSGEIRPVVATGIDVAHWPFPIANIYKGNGKDGLVAAAIRTASVVTSENIQTDNRTQKHHDHLRKFEFHSSASVPLRQGESIIGILGLVSNEANLFNAQDEIQLLEEMGMDISFALDMIALETARKEAEEQVRTQAARLKILADASQAFAETGSNYSALLERIVRMVVSLLADMCQIRLLSADGQLLELVAIDSLDADFSTTIRALETSRIKFAADQGLAANVIRTGEPVLRSSFPSSQLWASYPTEYRAFFERFPTHSLIMVPLRVDGRNIGALGLTRYRVQAPDFTQQDLHLAQDLADRAALAIHNVQLFAQVQNELSERQQVEQRIQNQLKRLRSLREIDSAISSSFNIKKSLDVVVSRAVTELNVDAADILVLNSDSGRFEYQSDWGFDTSAIQSYTIGLGEGIAGRCAQSGKPIHIRNLQEHASEFIRKPLLTEEKFIGYYCIPLINKMEVKGVLEIFHHAPLEPDQEWVDFLYSLAGQAAIAIENATLFAGLQRSNMELAQAYDATIVGWSRAMDLRDKETAGHTQRVTDMTLKLAQAAGVHDEEMIHIRRGALLHDMGKLGIPDDILLKPGKLTDEEWVIMRKHPQYAYDMLSFIPYLRPALDIPYCHHEKWDGTGYPRGLKGEQIPLAARLFAVVDVWDALCSDRPYRPGWPLEKVLEHIRAGLGTHFDPQAVALFLQVMGEKYIP